MRDPDVRPLTPRLAGAPPHPALKGERAVALGCVAARGDLVDAPAMLNTILRRTAVGALTIALVIGLAAPVAGRKTDSR